MTVHECKITQCLILLAHTYLNGDHPNLLTYFPGLRRVSTHRPTYLVHRRFLETVQDVREARQERQSKP